MTMLPLVATLSKMRRFRLKRRTTMNKLWLLLLLVMPYQSIHAQEVKHAPTVAQCRTDQKSYLSKLEKAPDTVSYKDMHSWFPEMFNCGQNVDPDNSLSYYTTRSESSAFQNARLENFLKRHHLWDQFLAEDAYGKR
jgi:hypothetical protein